MNLARQATETQEMTYAEAMERIYVEKFTGAALVHFADGVPQEVQPLVKAARIRMKGLDRRRRRAQD